MIMSFLEDIYIVQKLNYRLNLHYREQYISYHLFYPPIILDLICTHNLFFMHLRCIHFYYCKRSMNFILIRNCHFHIFGLFHRKIKEKCSRYLWGQILLCIHIFLILGCIFGYRHKVYRNISCCLKQLVYLIIISMFWWEHKLSN